MFVIPVGVRPGSSITKHGVTLQPKTFLIVVRALLVVTIIPVRPISTAPDTMESSEAESIAPPCSRAAFTATPLVLAAQLAKADL